MADFLWFSDEQWARIAPLLPQDKRGMPRVDDRRVLSSIVHALTSGGRWGDYPEHVYGPKKMLYNCFRRWAERGVWERIFADLAGLDGVPSRLFIDSFCIKVHRIAGDAKGGALAHGIGITKGGRNTKLYAICDEKGRPHVLLLTPGNTHDAEVAMLAINAVPPSDYLVADKGYDSNALRSWLIERGTTPVIPSKSNRKVQIGHNRQIYRQCNFVERMFCRSRTGAALPPGSTETSRRSWPPSPSQPLSHGGSNESGS